MLSLIKRRWSYYPLFLVLLVVACASTHSSDINSSTMKEMVLVPGGEFQMGDVFDEGEENEKPVHKVRLSDFYLGRYETTVAQYKAFVAETGYVTRAERLDSREKQLARYSKLVEKVMAGEQDEEFMTIYKEFMKSGGCHYWVSDPGTFDFSVDCNWRTPLFEQTDDDPVMCIAWVDAASYCNWLSEKDGLPPAYELDSGELLDKDGIPTVNIRNVKGYRLPTESEWEFAAREGGGKVRFGNGRNIARASEMNFNAVDGNNEYSEAGVYRDGTTRVGRFAPNSLGLYDMSGNAWEWCGDFYGDYADAEQVDPFRATGKHRVLRGGRWGGDASNARAFTRFPYEPIDRCNNSGFRIARTP
jgi:formylglycine-generating enzyme required for sulfatase activity